MKKIVYVVGGMLNPTGMGAILSNKINWLAEHTDYEIHMILTERPDIPWCYDINPKVKWVNFNINFDELDTMPFAKKVYHYYLKQKIYKKKFKKYLFSIRPDITISTIELDKQNDVAKKYQCLQEQLIFAKKHLKDLMREQDEYFDKEVVRMFDYE